MKTHAAQQPTSTTSTTTRRHLGDNANNMRPSSISSLYVSNRVLVSSARAEHLAVDNRRVIINWRRRRCLLVDLQKYVELVSNDQTRPRLSRPEDDLTPRHSPVRVQRYRFGSAFVMLKGFGGLNTLEKTSPCRWRHLISALKFSQEIKRLP